MSLNPCCFGTYFLSVLNQRWSTLAEISLNPCCFGTYFLSYSKLGEHN